MSQTWLHRLAGALGLSTLLAAGPATGEPLVLGLSVDLSAGAAEAGDSIRRGALIAIDEINETGGVLGRRLELASMDHRGNPTRGIDDVRRLIDRPEVVAIMAGLHSVVASAQLPAVTEAGMAMLVPWAAATRLVENDLSPNPVFRLSVRDSDVGRALVQSALRSGARRIGLLLEQTGWGRSNEEAIRAALGEAGLEPAHVQWFLQGAAEMQRSVVALAARGLDAVILIANPPEGAAAIRAFGSLAPEHRPPLLAHWGITGGRVFEETAGAAAAIDLAFIQTFSFLDPANPTLAAEVLARCGRLFGDCARAEQVRTPSGLAQAYDLTHLLARAIAVAGSADRAAVRVALETLPAHDGLVKRYEPPFTPTRREALRARDLKLARWNEAGLIVPHAK